MKLSKLTLFAVAMLATNSLFALDIENSEVGSGNSAANLGGQASYTCNIINEKSNFEIDVLKRFRNWSVDRRAGEIHRMLVNQAMLNSPGQRLLDPKLQAHLVEETLSFARKTRWAADQGDAFVNEFINPGSSEKCIQHTGFMTRIMYYVALIGAK